MAETRPMLPEWISPPGAIIAKILSSMQVGLDEFANGLGVSTRHARDLIDGSIGIDEAVAMRLPDVVGATPSFWLRAEQTYQDDLKRNLASYVDDKVKDWLRELPLKEMSELGWIRRSRHTIEQAEECFRFFGTISLDEWQRQQTKLLADVNFRTSEAYHSQPAATAAWLRWAEGKAEEKQCAPWNRNAFSKSLAIIYLRKQN